MTKSIFEFRFLVLQLVVFAIVVEGNLADCFGQKEFNGSPDAMAKPASIEPLAEFQLTLRNSSTASWGAMLSPDASRLVTWEQKSSQAFFGGRSWREGVKLWDVSAERLISRLEGDQVTAGDFAFSPSGKQFAYFDDQQLFVVNTDSGEKIAKAKLPGVLRVQFLANHPRLLLYSSVDGRPKLGTNKIQVQQMDIETWTLMSLSCGVIESDLYRSSIQATDEGRLWFKGKDHSIVCWDLDSDQEVVRIKSIAEDLKGLVKGVLVLEQIQLSVEGNRLCVLIPVNRFAGGMTVVNAIYRMDDGELDAIERDSQERNQELTKIGSWGDRKLSDYGPGLPMLQVSQSFGNVIDAGDRWDLIDSLNFRVAQSIPWTIEDLKRIGIPPKVDIQLSRSSTDDVITIAFRSLATGKVYALDIQDDSIDVHSSMSTRLPVEKTIVNRERNLVATVGYARNQTRNSGDECELVLMKLPTLTHHQTIDVGKVRPKRVVFSSDGNWIGGVFESIEDKPNVGIQRHSWVKIWDTNSGQLLFEPNLGSLGNKLAAGLTFSPGGGMLAVGGTNWVQIWDLNSKKQLKELRLSKLTPAYDRRGQKLNGNHHWLNEVNELIFSGEGTLIGLANEGEKLVAWDLESGKSLWLMLLGVSARNMQLDLSSRKLSMTSLAGEPLSIDLDTKQMSGKSTAQLFKDASGDYSHSYTVLAASRDQGRLLTVKRMQNAPPQRFQVVTVHELATGNRLAEQILGLERVEDAQWSGRHAVVAGRAPSSATLVIWDAVRKRKIGEITDYSQIHSKFVSRGRLFAVKDLYGSDGYALWRLADASKLAFLTHQGVHEIQESGSALLTISSDSLKIWKVPFLAETD